MTASAAAAAEPVTPSPAAGVAAMLGVDPSAVQSAGGETHGQATTATADAGGPQPHAELSDPAQTRVDGEDEDGDQDRDKHLVARPMDLPTTQAELLRRREEEDQAVRQDRTHAERRHDACEPARLSVWRTEGEILREPEDGGDLLIGETVTAGEILYAEHHRHEALGAALGLAVSGVMGTSVGLQGGDRRGEVEAADDVRGEDESGADRPLDKSRERDRAGDDDDGRGDLDTPTVLLDRLAGAAIADGKEDPGGPRPELAPGPSAAMQAKRLMATELGLICEAERVRAPAHEPDRDWDRDMELTR